MPFFDRPRPVLSLRSPKGFSLIEVMAGMTILVIAIGISISQIRSPETSRGPEAAASFLAEKLRAVQARAVSQGVPVGFALPGDGRASQSYYVLEGEVFPKIVESRSLASEFSETYLSLAPWAEAGEFSIEEPSVGQEFLIGAWQPPFPNDPTLIFLPNGQVTSNGLLRADDTYYLTLGSGLELSQSGATGDPGVTPATSPTVVQGVSNGQSIAISLTGSITEESSALRSSVASIVSAPPPDSVVAPPSLSRSSTVEPEILRITPHAAAAVDEELPTGSGGSRIAVNGFLTLDIEAWSPNGEDLFVEWFGPGHFSTKGPVPMDWVPQEGVWRAEADWRPDPSLEGEAVELEARVAGSRGTQGASVTQPISVNTDVVAGRIVSSRRNASSRVSLDDGSLSTALFEEPTWTSFAWSPDGSLIAAVELVDGESELSIVHPRVGKLRTILREPAILNPTWSPDGTKLAFGSNDPLSQQLTIINLDGTGRRDLVPADFVLQAGFSWHPDSSRLAATGAPASSPGSGLALVNTDGSDFTILSSGGQGSIHAFPSWSPDGQTLAFLRSDPTSTGITIRLHANGIFSDVPTTERLSGLTRGNGSNYLSWSPDGSYLALRGRFESEPPINSSRISIVEVSTGERTPFPNSWTLSHDPVVWSPTKNEFLFLESPTGDIFENRFLVYNVEDQSRRVIVPNDEGFSFSNYADWTL